MVVCNLYLSPAATICKMNSMHIIRHIMLSCLFFHLLFLNVNCFTSLFDVTILGRAEFKKSIVLVKAVSHRNLKYPILKFFWVFANIIDV